MSAQPVLVREDSDAGLRPEAIRVRDALVACGLETPMRPSRLSAAQKVQRITALMTDVVDTLGLDLADDSLVDTPKRIAKMYVEEIFSGLDYTAFRSSRSSKTNSAARRW